MTSFEVVFLFYYIVGKDGCRKQFIGSDVKRIRNIKQRI